MSIPNSCVYEVLDSCTTCWRAFVHASIGTVVVHHCSPISAAPLANAACRTHVSVLSIRSCCFPTGSSASHARHARATSTSMRRRPTTGRSASSTVRFTLVRPRTFEDDPRTSTGEERDPWRSTRKEAKATCFQHAWAHATHTNPSKVVRGTREDATPRLVGRWHGRNKPMRVTPSSLVERNGSLQHARVERYEPKGLTWIDGLPTMRKRSTTRIPCF